MDPSGTVEVVAVIPVVGEAPVVDPAPAPVVDVSASVVGPAPVIVDVSASVVDVSASVVGPALVPSTLDKDVEALFKVITTDSGFLKRVKESVDRIMHDGKVDQYDIPELVFVISATVNSLPTFQVTNEVVPVLIKMLYNFIVDTYKLVPEDKKAEFERMVDSSLRLLMLQPKVKEGLNRCFGFFAYLSSLSCCK